MDRRRAAGALLALAACIACSTAAPTASNQTALELHEGPSEGCYYNFQHYGEGDRIMTNEPCLNCTCHNRMLMCYLKVCPFTKPIGQDCTIEKRADQCCPIVTCPDVPVDLLTSTSTTSPAEYGATGLGKVDKYGCSINGKYFPEGSKVPPTPNKPCEHCYCIRNMTTCVMQECTLHVDGCTPIYHKDVCCPVRYSCDHLEDEMLLLDDMTTTVRPTPGFLLTTTTPSVTQTSQNCIHDDQVFADGALIKTELACEHCYCMKGDIVCVVQECGTPMENEGKNCSSLPPRQGQCCPDTYICEGDELLTDLTTGVVYEDLTTLPPPRRAEGSGYRNEPDEPYTEIPSFEGSGEEHATTLDLSDLFTSEKQTPQIMDEIFAATKDPLKPSLSTNEPDKGQNTVPDDESESTPASELSEKATLAHEPATTVHPTTFESIKEIDIFEPKTTISDYSSSSEATSFISIDDEYIMTTEKALHYTQPDSNKITEIKHDVEIETTEPVSIIEEVTSQQSYSEPSSSESSTIYIQEEKRTTLPSADAPKLNETSQPKVTTTEVPTDDSENDLDNKDKQELPLIHDKDYTGSLETTTASRVEPSDTTSVNPVENEIDKDLIPPGRIPGEGDCLLNGITYKNTTNVPNINSCHSSCKCISSIVKCDPIICSPPPEHMDNMNDCQPIYDTPDACCPTYVCHSRETIPPESHNQMSGTESPKPLHVKPETECQGEHCLPHKSQPILPEQCNSGNCKSEMEGQEKECKNGDCENTEVSINISPPEGCIGDVCLPSKESCTDGKCQQPTLSETICTNENGCQPSESCTGNDCVTGSEGATPINERPLCKDSEDCKVSSDTSNCDGSKCDKPNEDKAPSECTEESCRRKDQPQEEYKSPSECSGSSCNIHKVEGEPNILTTESAVKDQIYKEITTEIINQSYSKLPTPEETSTGETLKVTQFEASTVIQDTSPERSTDKSAEVSTQDLNEIVTEREESHTAAFESHATKIEEPVTEIYNKPDTEDYQTTIPETSTKSKEPITDFIENVTKEMSTKSSTTLYEDHPTYLPDAHIPDGVTEASPTTTLVSLTGTLDIKQQDHEKNTDDITDINVIGEFTKTQEITTKPTIVKETTFKPSETYVTEQEYTKEQEIFTKSPEETTLHVTENHEPINIITENPESTISPVDISITESTVTLLPETSDHKDTELHYEITNIPEQLATEHPIEFEQSSEPYETKLDGTDTNKKEKDNIPTEVIPTETTPYDIYKTEEQHELQTTAMETFPKDDDMYNTSSELFVKDQENLYQPIDTIDIITDKQDTFTTPTPSGTQESISSVKPAIQPSMSEEHIESETQETPISQQDDSNLPNSSIIDSPTSTSPQRFDIKDTMIDVTEIPVNKIDGITTESIDTHNIPLETVSDTLEEHTDTSVKETFPDTTNKDYLEKEPQDNGITTTQIEELEITLEPKYDEPTVGLETTISSLTSDKDQEISTKYTDNESGTEFNKETTDIPEVQFTKLDHPTSTVSSKQPHDDKIAISDNIQPTVPTQEIFVDESSIAPTISYTEGHDQTIPVFMDESKTKEKPLYTTPDTITQFTEKQGTVLTDDYVTKGTENDITGTESNEEAQKPTEHTISNEITPEHIATQASETTTQSQNTETKLATELQSDHEISTTPNHVVKEEKGQATESPMSLVTELSVKDETTHIPHVNVIDEEDTQAPEHHYTKPLYTESPQLTDSETPSHAVSEGQMISDKESQFESTFTSASPEYTTAKFSNIHDKENIPTITDYITEVAEKLSTAAENQDVTQKPAKIDTELYPIDVLHESTSVAPITLSSEQLFTTEEQEIFTKYIESSSSVTTPIYDHELGIKPESIPEKEQTLEDAKGKPQNNIDYTTPDTELLESSNKDQGVPQQEHDQKTTISPESFITKDSETLDQDKEIDKYKPSQKDEHTLEPEQFSPTEKVFNTKQSESPDIEIVSSTGQDQEKSTEVIDTLDEKDVTTSTYQDSTTFKEESMSHLPESHLSPTDILTTERSDVLPSDENNRRTLSPGFETIQPEQYTTEKQINTESPESTIILEMEKTGSTLEIPTMAPEKESITLVSIDQELDHVTAIPQATESDILLQTENISSPNENQELPIVTESIEKHTVEVQDITLKPSVEPSIDEDLHTKLPVVSVTEKDDMITHTIYDDFDKIPVDAMPVQTPSEHTVVQESQTETLIPKETEMSQPTHTAAPVTLETESEDPVTEIPVPKVTEPSTLKETDVTNSNIIQTSKSDVTKATMPEGTKESVPEITEASVPEITKETGSEVTEASVPGVTKETEFEVNEPSVPEGTKESVPEITEASVPEITKETGSEVTEASVPGVTKETEFEVNEPSVPEGTEESVPEVTEASMPDITKKIEFEVTEASVPEGTKESVSELTEAFAPEVTKETESEVTEASVPEGTKESVPEVTEASVPEGTKESVPEVTEDVAPEVTKETESEVTEASVPAGTKESVPEVTEASIPDVTKEFVPVITEASMPDLSKETESKVTEGSVPEGTKESESVVTEASVPEITKETGLKPTEASVSEGAKDSVPEVTEASVTGGTKESVPEVTDVIVPQVTKEAGSEVNEPSVTGGTKESVPEVTEASIPDVTKETESEVTAASVPEGTKDFVSEVTEATVPEITESEIIYKEPEGTTYKPKDEMSEVPMEQLPTLGPIDPSSETTPYLVELQEHTTKVDEDNSLVSLNEEDRTKAPDTYQTERGDQPLDNLPDKTTQDNSHEEYTTEETFTKKDEPSLLPEPASEHPEVISDKNEVTTEEIGMSSMSPMPTLLDTQIGQHTVSSLEQSVTMLPTASVTFSENDKFTTLFEMESSTDKKDLQLGTEKTPEHKITHETTGSDDALIPVITKATTIKTPEEVSTHLPVVDDKITKPEDNLSETYLPTTAPELPKPGISDIHPTEELSPPDHMGGYNPEPDEEEFEEDQAFGPGTCRYGGKVYVSAQQIPRDDPCDFCFCFRSDIICLQQSCPPPIHGCHEEPIQGFCCPRYECPVSMATTLNVTTTTTTTTTTLPPHFLPHAYKGAAQRRGCQIKGHSYKVGEVVRASSGPCLHCTCGGDGQMKCDPKACTPEPMLRQMIAAAVSAKRRR